MKRKPKPATATMGEKIAGDVYPEGTIDHAICRRRLSRSIDRAIARAVRNEKDRCGEWINHYASTNMQLSELRCAIAGDEHP